MFKRHRWLKNEDEHLKTFYSQQKHKTKIDWEIISVQMKQKNIIKTGKQCKERWKNQINPFLYNKKKKWTQEENKDLFELHRKNGNRWTVISKFFVGRSVNCVKNNFFKLMKKSLKNSIKFSGVEKSTFFINNLKPKILGNFLKSKYTVKIPVFLENGRAAGFKKKEIFISPFLEKFYFLKMSYKISRDECFVVQKVLDLIEEMNLKYVQKTSFRKKKRIEKRRKFEEFKKKGNLNHIEKISNIKKNLIIKKNQMENHLGNSKNMNNFNGIIKNNDLGRNYKKVLFNNIGKIQKNDNVISAPDPHFMFFQNELISENLKKKKNIDLENLTKNPIFTNGTNLKKNISNGEIFSKNFLDEGLKAGETDFKCECQKIKERNQILLKKQFLEKKIGISAYQKDLDVLRKKKDSKEFLELNLKDKQYLKEDN